MDFYHFNFVAFVLINSALAFYQTRCRQIPATESLEGKGNTAAAVKRFKMRFLPIYLLVNGADWLQGPYIYPIYKEEKQLPEEIVAALFMIGFIAAAVSATFTGTLADRFGRRRACLAFCLTYSLSCISLVSNNIVILFIGRCLGGMSATLMYTVFESWMVTEFNKVLPDEPAGTLSNLFSTMTSLNTLVAILMGLLAEGAVNVTNTQLTPFALSVCCLMLAFVGILSTWRENYGTSGQEAGESAQGLLERQDAPATKSVLSHLTHDKRILSLSLTSCVFEGSMYIFIFFKFPALIYSHKLSGQTSELPFGLIFANLMAAMMFGSMIYNYVTSINAVITTTRLLVTILSLASLCFCLPVIIRDERVTFWCFCIFEVCCGIYFPLIAYQRGKIIDDSVRARLYSTMRIPLNVFVVAVLGTTQEGQAHRDFVFLICSGLLVGTSVTNSMLL
ncbi:hypothetical protein WAI453_004249 [Rhynchosporium graminicola]|uniref:Molybdate-anion transporter n=1 Tax=Rhynchosporium graminicola TaxID=2792576 RepID=A0A1E1JWT2_9HELO|nr:related to major facilitator superfamily domain-containing protein 5 [Rhynchosporium commune]